MDRENIQKANRIWDSVLGKVELEIPKPSYDTWLRSTRGISCSSDEFIVETPNAFTAQYLEDRMLDMLEQELRAILEFGIKLKFTVANEIANDQSYGEDPSTTPYSRNEQTAKYTTANDALFEERVSEHQLRSHVGLNNFNAKYTFENFIVGNSNQLAYAGAQAVSENPGDTFNPLVIHSPVGLGKTHLLQAIGHKTKAKGLVTLYVTSEEFTNQYVMAIQSGQTEEFRDKYRKVDVLLIDDIQFLIGKEQTQEGFFHTFNSLHVENKQIVVASDRHISELKTLESRITSRLAGGLVADIQVPQLETRVAILNGKVQQRRYEIPKEVIEFLGERIQSKPISDSTISSEVSNYFGVTSDEIIGPRRSKSYLLPRQVTMFLLREETSLSLSAIGKILGGRDHSTVIHGHEKVASLINSDHKLRSDVLAIRNNLTS